MRTSSRPKTHRFVRQPEPSTTGLAKEMVRDHAWILYSDRLMRGFSLTRDDWARAEQDLIDNRMTAC
jgi:hypothetical protein